MDLILSTTTFHSIKDHDRLFRRLAHRGELVVDYVRLNILAGDEEQLDALRTAQDVQRAAGLEEAA